jgi:integrase
VPKAKITKSFVDRIPHAVRGQTAYCDTELRGFYMLVGRESKTYVAQKDIQGKTIRYTIGRHGHFTPEQARRIAQDKLNQMAQGINPNVANDKDERDNITLHDMLMHYITTRKNLKPKTKQDYQYKLQTYMSDWFDFKMVDITKGMIATRHNLLGDKSGGNTANGVMRIMRALFNHAYAVHEICEVNPVNYLSKTKSWYPETRRQNYIKPHQLQKWFAGVNALENDTYRDFFTFLIFTGLRRTECASIKWCNVDFNDRTFKIDDTKNGDSLTLPLGNHLYELLQRRHKQYSNYEFVFPSVGQFGYLAEPKKGVYKIIKYSGIQFTCHDLRRTFITIAESLEISSYALKRLINHRVTDVTGGYIIHDAERLRSPVNRIEEFILEKINGTS